MKTTLIALLAALTVPFLPAAEPEAGTAAERETPSDDARISAIEKLEKENELLRKENQALRRQVVALRSRLGTSKAEEAGADAKGGRKNGDLDAAAAKVKPDKENDEHWLSGGGRRHNSSCRYFKTGNGRPCTEKEGTPCKVCGG